MEYPVFFVSDSTGITAETLGHNLLAQFPGAQVNTHTLRFIDTLEKARACAESISRTGREAGLRPIVLATFARPDLRDALFQCDAHCLDLFGAFVGRLEQALGQASTHTIGHPHEVAAEPQYNRRMDAVNFALAADDGAGLKDYSQAQVIVTGVSRSGKTPTCLFLSLRFGIYAANYPLVEKDLDDLRLPAALKPYRDRLFGLVIDARRLHELRSARRPGSAYASLKVCDYESRQAEALFRGLDIPWLATTALSVEEIAASIVHRMGLAGST
jgi:hypothetical protein